MAPFELAASGTLGYALTFGAIGFGFGAVLEMGGFGDTRKLAAQFYLRDMTVLKVMFTAIIVAAVLVAGATAFGLLDMSRVWVNPTYLWPGVLGGLIMGVGFVLGGFCPGTSLVAASTLKIDGILFLVGAMVGVWLFGETVASYEGFWISSSMGRFTLAEWLGLPVGLTLLLVVLMALAMFWAGELAEQHFGQGKAWADISLWPGRGAKLGAAAALVLVTLVVLARGQPTPAEKFELLGEAVQRPVAERAVFVHPAEVVLLRQDLNLHAAMLDLRDEHDFNLFHVGGARRIEPASLSRPEVLKPLLAEPASTVTFLISNGEGPSLEAWRSLKASGVQNVYVVEGGVNRWLELYPVDACVATPAAAEAEADPLAFQFAFATGSSLPSAWPERPASRAFRTPCTSAASLEPAHGGHGSGWPAHQFARKVKLQSKAAVKGGCG
jgi:rhodanese-related sulfurtransferase